LEAGGEATARTAKSLARRSGTRRLDAATAGVRKTAAAAEEECMARRGE
jgi:hypothetical protein